MLSLGYKRGLCLLTSLEIYCFPQINYTQPRPPPDPCLNLRASGCFPDQTNQSVEFEYHKFDNNGPDEPSASRNGLEYSSNPYMVQCGSSQIPSFLSLRAKEPNLCHGRSISAKYLFAQVAHFRVSKQRMATAAQEDMWRGCSPGMIF